VYVEYVTQKRKSGSAAKKITTEKKERKYRKSTAIKDKFVVM
jgi:hypothetical protein